MDGTGYREDLRQRRHRRVRKKMFGTPERPRLAVFRSNRHISAQVIDDLHGRTLAAASTLDATIRGELGMHEISFAQPEVRRRIETLFGN